MRTNRVLLAAAASVLAFALTGCGGEDGGAKVPSAGGDTAKTAGATGGGDGGGPAGKDAIAAYVEGKRAWVKCMRDNGIQLDDPNDKGQVDLGGGDAVRTMKKDPKFAAASKKCQSVDPPLPEGYEEAVNPRPKLTPEQIKAARDYAACMQKNGAPDFPDPGPDGYQKNNNSATPEWDQTSAGAKNATRVCASISGNEVPDDAPTAQG
ncbi:hypothetical protein [Streptomyces tritici]|uniref:hypothetical protein n=1 Tax=Streptomyces tritici TaxID=2054410 RepID=UPI003AEFBB19